MYCNNISLSKINFGNILGKIEINIVIDLSLNNELDLNFFPLITLSISDAVKPL